MRKNTVQRIVAFFLTMAMLAGLAVPVMSNDGIVLSVRTAAGSGTTWGERVTLEVHLQNTTPPREIGAISFLYLSFDSAVLEWDLPEGGVAAYNRDNQATWPFAAGSLSTATQLTLNAPQRIGSNSVRLSFDSQAASTASGVLATVRLRIRNGVDLAPANVSLGWYSGRPGAGMTDFNGAALTPAVQGGVVQPVLTEWVGVGAQAGTMLEGVAGTVTFPVSTTQISAGSHPITVSGLPDGVTAPGTITVAANGSATLTLTAAAALASPGAHDLTLTVAGTESRPFTLTVSGRSVEVGAQVGAMVAGSTRTVTFPVATENIAAGTHPATIEGLPAGVSVQGGNIAIAANGSGTLTLVSTAAVAAGTIATLRLNIGGAVSAPFTLTVSPRTVTVGAQNGTLTEGVAGTVTFPITSNLPAGTHAATIVNLPANVSMQGSTIAINSDGAGTLTLASNAAVAIASSNNAVLTIDGVSSAPFTVTVRNASSLPHEPPVSIRVVGSGVNQQAEWFTTVGQGNVSWPKSFNASSGATDIGIGDHFIVFGASNDWVTSAAHAVIIEITEEGVALFDGSVPGHHTHAVTRATTTNARLLSQPDNPVIFVTWGDVPAGYDQIPGNAFVFGGSGPPPLQQPVVSWPANLTATVGQTLGDITLPANVGTEGTFSWASGNTVSVGNVGEQQHMLTFTPSSTATFATVSQNVTVTVTAGGGDIDYAGVLSAALGRTVTVNDDNMLLGVRTGTATGIVADLAEVTAVNSANGALRPLTTPLGTGTTITFTSGNVLTVVVLGDVDGNGVINEMDMVRIDMHIAGAINLTP